MKKIGVLGLLSLFLVLNLVIVIPNSAATTVEIMVNLDQHFVEYRMEPNCSYFLKVSGNVSCKIEGIGEDFQDVEVHLDVVDDYTWDPGIEPCIITFLSNGKHSINVSVNIPRKAVNRTINKVTVKGYWYLITQGYVNYDSRGDVKPDDFDLKIYRTTPPYYSTSTSGPPDKPKDLFEVLGLPCIIGLIIIPVVIIIVIIIYFYRRKKRNGQV